MPPKKDSHISYGSLVAYGLGGLIPIALFNVAEQLVRLMGNIGLGLSAFWLGVVLIIPRLWDAVSDPLMGHISDNTRSPWGRRRPYIFLGAIVVAISFCLLWWIPQGDGIREWFATEANYHWFQLSYILGLLLLFYTACTVFEIPHGALGMEMSSNRDDRTMLFSAKSFFGNLFAMGTPWLFALANLEIFTGVGGNMIDGMRRVSLIVAAVLVPLAIWWLIVLREPGYKRAQSQKKSSLKKDLKVACSNRTFIKLVIVVFTLAMGFNFVGLLNYYICIFYLYGGDKAAAGPLLGINGTIWAITGLVAVFPLNWISRRIGKKRTLFLAIFLMFGAQLAKIVCYNPAMPYLVIIPTVLLSSGMLMFFTLGSAMVGDICDEDELNTGTRSEGSYYSVFWWFIKMGTALASFVTGALIVVSQFDEQQSAKVDALEAQIKSIESLTDETSANALKQEVIATANLLKEHFEERATVNGSGEHYRSLITEIDQVREWVAADSTSLSGHDELHDALSSLAQQTPVALLRLRLIEIGIPLLLCMVSVAALRHYPLSEERLDEIKDALQRQRSGMTDPESLTTSR